MKPSGKALAVAALLSLFAGQVVVAQQQQPAPNAPAQPAPAPEALRVAERLVVAQRLDFQLKQSFPIMFRQLMTAFAGQNKQAQEVLQQSEKHFLAEFDSGIPFFQATMSRSLAMRFTPAEMEEMIRFFESPVGKKLIENQPGLMQDGMQAGTAYGRMIAPRVMEKMKQELENKGIKL